ncbi:hypothetical protein C8R45DRAFT_1014580 [Mycena sanguinolenta]|nr:hypothetical protein C8R45DRAFT_1014580 [Mycena sanguinolenta]
MCLIRASCAFIVFGAHPLLLVFPPLVFSGARFVAVLLLSLSSPVYCASIAFLLTDICFVIDRDPVWRRMHTILSSLFPSSSLACVPGVWLYGSCT